MTALARVARSPGGAGIAVTLLALAIVTLVVSAGGYDVGLAARALWNGSFGNPYAFFSGTLIRATPLVIVGLAVSVAFQAGVLNIGAEGQLLVGASAAVAVGLSLATLKGWLSIPLELAAGMVAGAAWAGIAAALRRRFAVLEVISTLMLNFIALFAVSYLVRGPLQEPSHLYPQTAGLAESARLPVIMPGQRLHLGFVAALVLAATAWWFLRFTTSGFRLRVAGAGAAAAASAGRIDVTRVTSGAFLASGALAGLGGAVQATGVTYALFEGISPGYGYTAIAVALLARLDPLAVVVAGVFFGGLEAGGAAMQRDAGVPSGFVAVVEALIVLGVLAADRARTLAGERTRAMTGEPTS